jgi:amino acid transporter
LYGTAGGFTTFVSNSAGPIMNTYLVGLGLDRTALVGTSAWFYFAVNLAKIPVYLAIGAWSTGGAFFSAESLRYDLVLLPFVVIGVYGGRALLPRLHDRFFLWLVLSLAGAVKLLLPA